MMSGCVDYEGAPVIAKEALAFCPYKGRVCCDSAKDSQLKKEFEAMDISDPDCASAIKSILCAVSLSITTSIHMCFPLSSSH